MGLEARGDVSVVEHFGLAETDKVIIQFFPKGRIGQGSEMRQFVVEDWPTIQRILSLLEMVPACGPGLMIKHSPSSPEYYLSFHKSSDVLGQLRGKDINLDSPVRAGWSFYIGDDRAFMEFIRSHVSKRDDA